MDTWHRELFGRAGRLGTASIGVGVGALLPALRAHAQAVQSSAAPASAAAPVAHLPGLSYVVKADAISGGDTAWLLTSAVLVMLMTLPGLALFYGGLVRKRNILGTMTQVFACACAVAAGGVIGTTSAAGRIRKPPPW